MKTHWVSWGVRIVAALTFMGFVPRALATEILTAPKIRQTLLAKYNFSEADADRVINALEHAQGKHPLPIKSMIWTHGFSSTLFYGTGYWPNLSTTFVDEASGEVIETKCLYDMVYRNGGLAASIGYRWVLMFLTAPANAGQLTGARFGRGVGFDYGYKYYGNLGVQFLPGKNVDGAMVVVSPMLGPSRGMIPGFGWQPGLRFPRIDLVASKNCRP